MSVAPQPYITINIGPLSFQVRQREEDDYPRWVPFFLRGRSTAFVLALLLELLMVLAVVSIGWVSQQQEKKQDIIVSMKSMSMDAEPQKKESPKVGVHQTKKPTTPRQKRQEQTQPVPSQAQAAVPQPAPPAPATNPSPAAALPQIIILSRDQMASADISKMTHPGSGPPSPARGKMGPPAMAMPGDSKVVGTAPDGSPLFAASWYREPYDDELRGYFEAANSKSGWGQIMCKTAPDYRVEQCRIEGEYPEGSRLGHAAESAAWQFLVRPPRKGGVSIVGAWVSIRICWNSSGCGR